MNNELKTPLIINGSFSFASGALLFAAPGLVGGWLGVDIDGWLRIMGALLIGHGLLIAVGLSKLDTPTLAKVNLAMIAPYPALMILVVVTGWVSRSLGQALALVDGAVIAGIALWLFSALRGSLDTTTTAAQST